MGMGSKTCSKCGGRMEEGRVLTKDSYSARNMMGWIAGIPERSVWTGLKTKGKTIHDVATFRCGKCGYLEDYAQG